MGKIKVLGTPIDPSFDPSLDREEVRAKYGLSGRLL